MYQYEEWSKDPEFKALDEDTKASIYLNYFDSEIADNEFRGLDDREQKQIKEGYLNSLGLQYERPIPDQTVTRHPGVFSEDLGPSPEEMMGAPPDEAVPDEMALGHTAPQAVPDEMAAAHTPSAYKFDPEGSGYDYATAIKSGIQPDETGHWPSRDPETGQILKGRGHETFDKTIAGEEEAGYKIVKGKDGKYYSFPKEYDQPIYEELGLPVGEPGKGPASLAFKALGIMFEPIDRAYEGKIYGIYGKGDTEKKVPVSLSDLVGKAAEGAAEIFPGGFSPESPWDDYDLNPKMAATLAKEAVRYGIVYHAWSRLLTSAFYRMAEAGKSAWEGWKATGDWKYYDKAKDAYRGFTVQDKNKYAMEWMMKNDPKGEGQAAANIFEKRYGYRSEFDPRGPGEVPGEAAPKAGARPAGPAETRQIGATAERPHVETEIPEGHRYVPKEKLTKGIMEDYEYAGKEITPEKADEVAGAITDYITHTGRTIVQSDLGVLAKETGLPGDLVGKYKKEADLINEYIRTAPSYPKDAPIYRGKTAGAKEYKDAKVGDVLTIGPITSWSSSKDVAKNFATAGQERFPGWEIEDALILKTKGVKDSASLKQFSNKLYAGGDEVAVARGQKFKITSITEEPITRKIDGKTANIKVIELEPVEEQAAIPYKVEELTPKEELESLSKKLAGGKIPVGIQSVPTESLTFDPERFQYKKEGVKAGVTTKLKEIKKYDPELAGVIGVWRDPADGKIYVINGHHRYELAKRTGYPEMAVMFLKADNAEQALIRGAMINIAENNGTPIDASRIFKKHNMTAEEIKKKHGLSLKGEVARKGYALSRLHDGIFNDVINQEIPENWAVAIGEGLPDSQDAQLAVVKVLERERKRGRRISVGIVEQIIKDAIGGKKKTEIQTSLFGKEVTERPLLIERAELRDYASKVLASDRHLFGTVSKKQRAERLAELAENVIDIEKSQAVADEADTIKRVLDTLASSKGPIGDALNEYAGRLADATGQERNAIKQGFVDELRKIVPRVIKGGKRKGPGGGGALSEGGRRLAAKEPILESKVRARGDEFGSLFKPSKIKPKTEVIDPSGMYVDWAQTKITEKAGMKGTYYGVFNKDGSFKKWMNRTEIERIKKAEGKPILTLGQENYGTQKVKGAKSKQMGLGLVAEDKSQPTLFRKVKAKPPWEARGLPRPPVKVTREDADYIISLLKEGRTPSTEPGQRVILTGGPSGAGKSSALKGLEIDKSDFVVADPDKIKELAGYATGDDAIKFHETSSRINKRLTDEAINEGYDLIYDSLLANYQKAKSIVERVVSRGGTAEVIFVNIDAETSQARSIMRNMLFNTETGQYMSERAVPVSASVKGYNSSLPTFLQLFKEYEGDPNVDFLLVDNNEDNALAKLVFRQRQGKISIYDNDLFDNLTGIDYVKSGNSKGGFRYERSPKLQENTLTEKIPYLTERAKATARQIAEGGKYAYRPGGIGQLHEGPGPKLAVKEEVLARKKVAPKPEAGPPKKTAKVPNKKRHDELLKIIQDRLELPIRVGKFRQKAAGIYKTRSQVARIKQANDIPTALHETGHHIQEILGLSGEMPPEVQALAYKDAADPSKEGFAEFVRLYGTQPEVAKTAAPNFYKTFESALENNTDIQDVLVEIRTAWQDFQASPAAQKVGSFVVSGGRKGGKISFNKIYTRVKDNLWPIRQAVKMAEDKGHKFTASQDPYILARLTRGWARKAEQYLKYGTFQLDEFGGMVKTGPSLTEILKPIEKQGLRDQLDIYLIAKRAITDPKDRIVKGFDGILTRKDFQQVVQELDGKFKGIADQLQKYNDELLKYLVSSGRISQDLYEGIKANNPFYAPLYRFFDDEPQIGRLGQKSGNLFSPIKKLRGSSRTIFSPTESLLYNTYATINAAERSRIGAAMVRMSKLKGMGGLIENIPFPLKPTVANKEDLIRLLNKYDLDEFDFSDLPDEMILTFRPAYRAGPNEVIFYEEGKPRLYEIGDPELFEALANVSPGDINAAIKFVSYPAKWLRAGATTFSPEFGIRNPLRDQMTAWIQSEYGYKPGFDFLRGTFHMMGKTETWQKFNSGGAAHSNIVSIDRNYLKKNLHELFKSPWKGVVKNPLELIQAISEITEEATRVGEFARALKVEGGDMDALLKAAYAAREVSLDFNRAGGATARSLNMISAFWNARLEGLDKMVRVHKKHPIRSALIAFMGVTLPSILLWYAQKDDIYYNELPAWRRVLFWNIITHKPDGTLNHVISIPKPFEWGLIYGTLPEMALDWYYTKEKDAFIEALDQIKESLNLFPMPTGATPIIEWFANKSIFFDRPIVPRGKEDLPPVQQVRPGQSETVKLIAEFMDKIPGLKEVASPAKLENLLLGYTAGLGKVGLQAGDWLIENLGVVDAPPDPEMKWSQLPGIRAVFHRFPSANTRSIEQFYKKYLDTKRAWESKKESAGLRGSLLTELPGGRKYIPPPPPDLKYYEKAAKALSLLRKLSSEVYKSKKLSPEQKRERLDNIYMNMINTARTALQKGKIK